MFIHLWPWSHMSFLTSGKLSTNIFSSTGAGGSSSTILGCFFLSSFSLSYIYCVE